MNKIKAYEYFNKQDCVNNYTSMYGIPNFKKEYPANKQRLSVIMTLLDKIKPINVIDAGCGAGMPLIEILKMGYNVSGYDKAMNMVEKAKANLSANNLDPERVCIGNFENPMHLVDESYDCITGMGAFYYANDILETLRNQRKKLKKGGHLIFSLRNKLFDLVTLNEYTHRFLNELFQINKYGDAIQDTFHAKFIKNDSYKKKFNNIDEAGVHSLVHNPLTVDNELLKPLGLSLQGLFFYHFHALPPMFEHIIPEEFRESSWQMEDPTDWRGYFLSSAFIVHCIKS